MSTLETPPPSADELEALRQAEAELAASPAVPVPVVNDEETGVKRIMLLPLLNEHSGLIEALRAACQADLNSDPDPVMTNHYNDNVFLLRFLISAKYKLEKAISAVKTTIAWRNKNREMLARMRAGEAIPGQKEFQKFNIAEEHHGRTTLEGGPLLIVRSGLSDVGAAVDKVDHQFIYNTLVFSKERQYIACDQLSRQKGYLVKLVTIMDMAHASFTKALDRRWFKMMGDITKEMELCYPQLLGANVIVNAPGWVRLAMGVASKFLPASTLEKMVLCGHKVPTYDAKRKGVDIVKNPYAWARFVAAENVPTFLGGTCKCRANERFPNGRCIASIDNDRKISVTEKPYPVYE